MDNTFTSTSSPLPEDLTQKSEKANTIELPAEKITILNVDDLKQNSVLIVNVDVKSPEHKMALAPVFAKLFTPFSQKLREKSVTVMLMSLKESIQMISEEDMNNAGWFKKEKSLIIKPFGRP